MKIIKIPEMTTSADLSEIMFGGPSQIGGAGTRLRIKSYRRRSYKRSSDGKRIPATTVKGHFRPDFGAPGRGSIKIPFDAKYLHGYQPAKTASDRERHRQLYALARDKGSLPVLRSLNVLKTLNKRNRRGRGTYRARLRRDFSYI